MARTAKRSLVRRNAGPRQVNIRVEPALYRAVEVVARQERRSLGQAARQLLEEGLRHRVTTVGAADDTSGVQVAQLALAGGGFDWLAGDPDLYDESSGEPV